MPTPHDAVVDLVNKLDADLREAWEERAGIMEFDSGLSREHAECLALLEVIRHHPEKVLSLLR
jgi:hypothetical protein